MKSATVYGVYGNPSWWLSFFLSILESNKCKQLVHKRIIKCNFIIKYAILTTQEIATECFVLCKNTFLEICCYTIKQLECNTYVHIGSSPKLMHTYTERLVKTLLSPCTFLWISRREDSLLDEEQLQSNVMYACAHASCTQERLLNSGKLFRSKKSMHSFSWKPVQQLDKTDVCMGEEDTEEKTTHEDMDDRTQ